MKVEHIHEGKRYIFSNEGIIAGNDVFPIGDGRVGPNDEYIFHSFSFEDYCTGFPDEPHKMLNTKYSNYKPYEAHTDHGFGPIESYFKIIAIEEIPPASKISIIAKKEALNLKK